MDTLKIAFMQKSEIAEVAKVLSVAMLNNPLHIAVFQGKDERERREIEKMFLKLFTELPAIVMLAKEGEKIIGVMRMKSCDGRSPEDSSDAPGDENDIDWRKSVWHNEWARHDPRYQHWHLGPIGVLPSLQGSGVGSELMRRFCKEVDLCSADAYLETDFDKNVRFYEKFGFKLVSETEIFDVKSRYMARASTHDAMS